MDSSPPGSSVHGILQARILQWVAVSFFRDLSDPGVEAAPLTSPAVVGGFLTTSITWEGLYWGRHRIKKNCQIIVNAMKKTEARWWWDLDLDLSPVWERLEEVNCLIRMFPEGISMEVMFELALGWWEGNSHWKNDSKCKNPEVLVNWWDSGTEG